LNALYDAIGKGYARYRRPDPRIAALINKALGDAASVINVGAGAGSYEPTDRPVTAIEPSATMIAQRLPGSAKAIQASAESLPFPDRSFDAATAFLTTHHWADRIAGLKEMRRVARKRCVFLDHDPMREPGWLIDDYFPQMRASARQLLPDEDVRAVFGTFRTLPVPVPQDCTDGFLYAYWRRPEQYLDPEVRAAISFFAQMGDISQTLARLRQDLADGTWAKRNAHLLQRTEMDYGYRLVIAELE
jgi:SAM-dependent methyltransferase